VEFRILGLLEVVDDGRPVSIGRGRERALLALLLLNANRPLSTERLVEELWEGRRPPKNAAKTVQIYVSRLRGRLGAERILTTPIGYALELEPSELDAGRFERLAGEGQAHLAAGEAERAELVLSEALGLWRGDALADFRFEAFARAEIGRLEERRGAAVADRVDARLVRGRANELIGELEALVREQPLRERPRRQLMLALYQAGRQADALDVYAGTRRALVEELGIEPSRELRDLQQAILRQDPTLDLVAGAVPTAEPVRGVFVGRGRELEQLVSALDDAFAGRGRLVLLVGEPGIGKSRLADELIAHTQARRARVLVGRCWEAGGAPAYWPWVQALRAYIRETNREVLAAQLGTAAPAAAQLLPDLRELFPDLPEPPELEPESARFRLFEAIATLLRNAAAERPLVLVLDDLHAADEPSLLLLQFVVRELADSRVLVIGAYRNVDPVPTDPLTTALAELVREPVTTTLALTGLGEPDVASFIELVAGEAPAGGRLAAAIHEETDGNPLFVGEIVRLLVAEGALHETDPPRLVIPQSVREVIARRLRHLSEDCNRLLVLAAVLGREWRFDALARAGGVSEDELLDLLDEAMAARVVSELPGSPGQARFAHVLIRDTLYDRLTAARRVRLHRLAMEALEALYGEESGPQLAELAHHAVAGADFDKGLLYARRAADRALTLLGYEEAARLYRMALEALELSDPNDESARCELLLSLGEAESRAGNSPVAKDTFLEGAAIARRLELPRELARAAAGYGGRIVFARAGDDDRLVPLLEEGLAALGEEDVELQARLLARLAGALRDEHSRERRDALSGEAVELARRTGNPAALAYALAGRGASIIAPDTVTELLALGSELCQLADRTGNPELLCEGHYLREMAELLIGDIHAAEVDLAATSRLAAELGQPVHLWRACADQAMLALAAGRLSEAEELIPQAFAHGERALPELAIPVYRLQRYTLCDFQGDVGELEPAIRELVVGYPARPVFRCVLAQLYAQLGRIGDARRELESLAVDGFAPLPFDQEWLFGMSFLAETCALLRDAPSSAVLYSLLVPWAAFNALDSSEGFRGSVSRYLGLLAATMGRWSEAAGHFAEALAMNDRQGVRPWLAQTQIEFARMLLERDEPGDRERVKELLDHALATCKELGMEGNATRALRLVDEVSTRA
jgi:DNA-binding SARP family transcriptional activator